MIMTLAQKHRREPTLARSSSPPTISSKAAAEALSRDRNSWRQRVFGTSMPSSTPPQQQKRHRNLNVDDVHPLAVRSSSTPPPFSGGDKDNDSRDEEDALIIVETQTNDQVLQAKFDDAKKKGLVIAVDQDSSDEEAVLVKFVNTTGKNDPRLSLLEVTASLWYKDDNDGCLVYWDEIENGQELDVWTFPGTKWYIYNDSTDGGGGGVRSSTKLGLEFTIQRYTTGNNKKQRIEF